MSLMNISDGMEDSDSHCPAFADFGVSFIDSDYFVAFQTDNGEIVPVEVLAEESWSTLQ